MEVKFDSEIEERKFIQRANDKTTRDSPSMIEIRSKLKKIRKMKRSPTIK